MKLLRLRMRDFLIYGDVDLDLSQIKLASIIGQYTVDRRRSNGSGKTALLEAIRYALYDQTRSKVKLGIVRTGAKESLVELEFEIGHKHVRVQRLRDSEGNSVAYLVIDGKKAGDKIKVVNESLEALIGISCDLFDNIYFFKQGDQFGFVEANPSERKSALAKVLRMDALVSCAEIAVQRRKDAEIAVASITSVSENLGSRNILLPAYHLLREQESTASANLASAMQLQAHYSGFDTDAALDKDHFRKCLVEFDDEIANDKKLIDDIQKKLSASNHELVSYQQKIQTATAHFDRYSSEVESLQKKIGDSNLSADELNTESLVQKKALETIAQDILEINKKLSIVVNDLTKINSKKTNASAGQECPVCRQFVPIDHVERLDRHVASETQQLNVEKKYLEKALQEKQAEKFKIQARIDRIETIKSLSKELEQKIELQGVYKTQVRSLERSLGQLNDDRQSIMSEQSLILQRIDSGLIDRTRTHLNKLRVQFENLFNLSATRGREISKNVETMIAVHTDLANKLEQRRVLDIEIAANKIAVAAAKDNLIVSGYLADAFGKNGIQALLVENAIGVIETFANEILRQMQTRFTISLKTQKETKAGDLKESLDIIVYDNGHEKPFENYSGGERTLVNIALRLSLSRVIASLHGVQMSCLFLDEVLAPLDSVNREEAIKIIAYLSRSFEQIFVVSHTDEVKDIIDCALIIERGDDKSTVRITHGRTNQASSDGPKTS